MKHLKVKFTIFSVLAVLAVSLIMISCEQEAILDNQVFTEEVILPNPNDLLNAELPREIAGAPSSVENRHYVYEEESVSLGIWRNTNVFPNEEYRMYMEVRSEISHGSHGAGYYKSNAEVCGVKTFGCSTMGYGLKDIWVLQVHYYWNADDEEWYGCTATGWVKNSEDFQKVELAINHPENTPRCDDAWYGNLTYSFFHNPVSEEYEWGPTVWSGYHWLPD